MSEVKYRSELATTFWLIISAFDSWRLSDSERASALGLPMEEYRFVIEQDSPDPLSNLIVPDSLTVERTILLERLATLLTHENLSPRVERYTDKVMKATPDYRLIRMLRLDGLSLYEHIASGDIESLRLVDEYASRNFRLPLMG